MRRRTIGIGIILGTLGILLGCLLLVLTSNVAAGWFSPNTPLDAGREWFVPQDAAGKPDHQVPDNAQILAEQPITPDKRIMLYAWRWSSTSAPTALTVVPLGIQRTRMRLLPWAPRPGWHPAGVAGRPASLPTGDEFVAGSLPAGFNGLEEPVATAWGLSARGSAVRITWSDGVVTLAPLRNKAFLQTRPDPNYPQHLNQRLNVRRVELLDAQGSAIAIRGFSGGVLPEVREQ